MPAVSSAATRLAGFAMVRAFTVDCSRRPKERMKPFLRFLSVVLLAGVSLRAQSNYATPYAFTTLAGNAGYGAADGPPSVARFNGPSSVAVDGAGNIYVADRNNHTIRKITTGGLVTTLAGTAGSAGSTDGTGGGARFNSPSGVAVDGAGNVFVADTGNSTVRKITSDGSVTTVAGKAGNLGSTDGTAGAAQFYSPQGVAVDGVGNLFVADISNNTIRKITVGGLVTTLAGAAGLAGSADGTGSAARFSQPSGIAVDSGGNIYVGDSGNNTIRRITSGGVVTTLAGAAGPGNLGAADGPGSAARFNGPQGVAVDGAGNVYVADGANSTIRKIAGGGVTTLAGKAGSAASVDATQGAARFNNAAGVALDGAGNLLVADTGNNTIRKIASGGVVTTVAAVAGSVGSTDGAGSAARFIQPAGVAVDGAGNVYVADSFSNTIRKLGSGGVVTTLAGTAGGLGGSDGTGSAAQFNDPTGVAADSAGNVYVADAGNHAIRMIASGGVVTTLAGKAGSVGSTDGVRSAARFHSPSGLAVDGAGNVYVADTGNNTVRKITSGGVVTTLAGAAGLFGSVDGTGGAARFSQPSGVAVDSAGNVYVADTGNNTIRKITSGGVVTTLAGAAGPGNLGAADGPGSAARFNGPQGVAVDGAGSVYVADAFNATIRKITSDGVVTTLAGAAGTLGVADGSGSAAQFGRPASVAVDGAGNLDVADFTNNTIRFGTLFVPPASLTLASGNTATLAAGDTGFGIAYQWQRNGTALSGAVDSTLSLANVQPANAGLYTYTVAIPGGAGGSSDPAILGVSTTSEVIGAGTVLQPTHIPHPNGNIFDQILLTGAAETLTALPGQAARTSYIDLNNDIVQVEFSGAGTLSLVLDNASGAALPVNYNQNQAYIKGHAGIVIAGADETTNVSIFTVGRATAFDPTGAFNILQPVSATNNPANNGSPLFAGHASTAYDGVADIGFIAITSTNGKFGGVRAADASCFATQGYTGIYAPSVQFTGPVFIGDINASAAATPVFIIGSSPDTRITGGDFSQANGQPVKVSGLTLLKFTAGTTSNNVALPAQTNKAVLQQNGVDITAQIVVNPGS